jgi:hypothetical protein
MKTNLTPETMAAHLFQMFQSHAIDIPQDQRKAYTIFAAVQHCNIVSYPDLPIEDLNYWHDVIKILENKI